MPTPTPFSPGSRDGITAPDIAKLIAMPEYATRDTSRSCETFTASVGLMPGATFVIRRSAPGEPTETVFAWSATEWAPSATELFAVACALAPIATESFPAASELSPMAVAGSAIACAWLPIATEPLNFATARKPTAVAFSSSALAYAP
jgi:hypothetical protein